MPKRNIFERYDNFSRDDPVGRLAIHYFYPCDFVYRDYQRVSRALARQKLRTRWRASQQLAYIRLWLSTLYAVIEGYRELGLKDPDIDLFLAEQSHVESLRRFRNGTFHYQLTAEKQIQFVKDEPGRMDWAEALHKLLEDYFSRYRMSVVVKNFLAETQST